jgi:hypothetical protein
MDWLRLTRTEIENDELPRVCACCGAPATTSRNTTFSWCPAWAKVLLLAGLLPGLIAIAALTRSVRMTVPLCARHKKRWARRNFFLAVGLLLPGLLALFLVALGSGSEGHGGDVFLYCALFYGGLGFLTWVVVALRLKPAYPPGIRPQEITDRDITLTGVADDFVRTVQDRRRNRGD